MTSVRERLDRAITLLRAAQILLEGHRDYSAELGRVLGERIVGLEAPVHRLVSLVRISDSHPTEWEGRYSDGRLVSVLYRGGVLSVMLEPGIQAGAKPVYLVRMLTGPVDGGNLSNEGLRDALKYECRLPAEIRDALHVWPRGLRHPVRERVQ